MHIIPPLTINAGTHFTYPQRDWGLSQSPSRLSREQVLNLGPVTWQSAALPTELSQRDKYNSQVTSAVYIHSIPNIHPSSNSSHFKIIDQHSKQVVREAIHITIRNHVFNCNTGKMYIPEIFNHLLGVDRSSNESDEMVDSNLPQGCTHLTFPSNRFFSAVCLAN